MPVTINGSGGITSNDGSAAAPPIAGTDTNTGIFFPAADTIAFAEGGAEVARFDSSGNFGIGTSSPATKLDVSGPASVTSFTGTTKLGVTVRGSTAATDYSGIDLIGNNQTNPVARIAVLTTGGGSSLSFGTSNSYGSGITNTAATIDPSGNLLVNTTAQQTGGNGKLSVAGGSGGVAATLTNNSNASAYTTEIYNYTTSTGAGSGRYVKFAMGSTPTQTGSIIGDGTNTAYNTSSDYRLKENVAPMTGALALVMQQRPVTWTWKTSGKPGKGFIAHWLQEDGAGECVSGEKDAVDADGNPDYQGVDTSFLVATLTAAIQEQQALIESLTARIAALEAA